MALIYLLLGLEVLIVIGIGFYLIKKIRMLKKVKRERKKKNELL